MMIILSSSPSSSYDDDRVIITIIISGGGCRGRKHAWKLGVLVISLFLDRTQKPYLLSVVEIVGELKPKGWGNQKAEETKRFRKHDPEISTHCYPDAQTDREAVMQREWERTKKPNDRQSVKDQSRHSQTRSDARASNVKTTKDRTKACLKHSWASKCQIWVDCHFFCCPVVS